MSNITWTADGPGYFIGRRAGVIVGTVERKRTFLNLSRLWIARVIGEDNKTRTVGHATACMTVPGEVVAQRMVEAAL